MKKLLRVIPLILAVCCVAILLTACQTPSIEAAYAKMKGVDEADVTYESYGEFDGTHVLIMSHKDMFVTEAIHHETVDGVDFHFSVLISFDVFRNGKFYTLQEAFDNGWVSHENLLTVRENHKAKDESIYEYYESRFSD